MAVVDAALMQRFADATAKVARSMTHYRELTGAIKEYEDHYGPTVEKVVEGSGNVYRARISSEPTVNLSLIVGDFVHNLRSALDYATCALVGVSDPEAPLGRVQFPFGRAGHLLNSNERRGLGRSHEATQALEDARSLGGSALMLLNELSNQDKHRLLVTSVIRQQKAEIEIDFSKNTADIIASPALDMRLWNRALADGDILAEDTDANPAFGLMFSFVFGLVLDGQPEAVPINELHNLGRATEQALQLIQARALALAGSQADCISIEE